MEEGGVRFGQGLRTTMEVEGSRVSLCYHGCVLADIVLLLVGVNRMLIWDIISSESIYYRGGLTEARLRR